MNVKKAFPPLLFLLSLSVFGQSAPGETPDPSALIGTTLADLLGGYGAPNSVYPVRGLAPWQDDVVFVYDSAEFFIYGNRVWQLKLKAAYGIAEGQTQDQVVRILGQGEALEGYSTFSLPSRVWPLTLRVNWDSSDRVSAIYIYRSDF
ncbi:MAG: hypothetical protein LBI67_08260 [Treponema sp.]|jgi:hypothetical protein|nr:hypothetical protein [Treponema sp.]